jgi:hypothetical protein
MIFGRKQERVLPQVDVQKAVVAAIINGGRLLPSKRFADALFMGVLDNRDMSINDIEALANRLSRLAWERARR